MKVKCVTDMFDGSNNIDRQSELTKGKIYDVIEAEIYGEGFVSNRHQFLIKDDNGNVQWYYRYDGMKKSTYLEIIDSEVTLPPEIVKLDNKMKVGDEIQLMERFTYDNGNIVVDLDPGVFKIKGLINHMIHMIPNSISVEIHIRNDIFTNLPITFSTDSVYGKKFRKYFRNKNLRELLNK